MGTRGKCINGLLDVRACGNAMINCVVCKICQKGSNVCALLKIKMLNANYHVGISTTQRSTFANLGRLTQHWYCTTILMLEYHQDGILCRPYQVPCGTYNTISE